jgi:hypothetical protein
VTPGLARRAARRRAGALVALTAAVLAAAGCSGSGPLGPPSDAPLDHGLVSEHFEFHFAGGDTIRPDEAAINDRAYEIIRDALETDFSRRIEFNKFFDADHIERLTGVRTQGGFVIGGRIFLIRALDPHEIVHVIAHEELGRPSDFFDEGLAVNFGGLRVVDGEVTLFPSALRNFDVDREALTVFAGDRFAGSIRQILTSADFQRLPFEVTYPLAGSFVKFLLRSRGVPALKTFFASSSRLDSQAAIEERLTLAFGVPLDDLEAEWRAGAGLPSADRVLPRRAIAAAQPGPRGLTTRE